MTDRVTRNLGRKPTIALLAASALVSVILRYPTVGEIGVDSFFIHALSQSIVGSGRALWILNPTSYFGWYPLSYPSGGPFLIASTSLLSGQNVETVILLTTILLGPIGTLGAFLLARAFWTNDYFASAVSVIYGFAPRFLTFTLWTASTRNLFMAILPLAIWALLRLHGRARWPEFAVAALLIVSLAAAHRLVVLVLAMAGALLIAEIIFVGIEIIRRRRPRALLRGYLRGTTRWVTFLAAMAIGLGVLLGSQVLDQYSQGELASGSSTPTELFNLGVSLVRTVGLALPLAIFGLAYLTKERNLSIRHAFLVIGSIGLIPTLLLRDYAGFYILPFLAVFGGYGLFFISGRFRDRRRLAASVIVAVVLSLGVVSASVLQYELGHSPYATAEEYTVSSYLAYFPERGTVLSNDGLIMGRIGAVGGVDFMPTSGGVGTPGPEYLVFGYLTPDQVNNGTTRLSLANFTSDSNSLWTYEGVDTLSDYAVLMDSSLGALPRALLNRYQPVEYLELKAISGSYYDYTQNLHPSELGATAHAQAYRVYDDGTQAIWWIG